MRLFVGLSALLAVVPPVGAQQSTPGERLPVVKFVLPNGMTFLFLRREGAPTVSFVTHFRAGGVDEWTGISGTAHLFEHMLFKGTHTIGTNNYGAEQAMFPRIDAVADSLTAEFRKGDAADTTLLERLRGRRGCPAGRVPPAPPPPARGRGGRADPSPGPAPPRGNPPAASTAPTPPSSPSWVTSPSKR